MKPLPEAKLPALNVPALLRNTEKKEPDMALKYDEDFDDQLSDDTEKQEHSSWFKRMKKGIRLILFLLCIFLRQAYQRCSWYIDFRLLSFPRYW